MAAQENLSPFGTVGADEVYSHIGRLYSQLWAASKANGELSLSLSFEQEKNVEQAAKIAQLESLINEKTTSMNEKQASPKMPKNVTIRPGPKAEGE